MRNQAIDDLGIIPALLPTNYDELDRGCKLSSNEIQSEFLKSSPIARAQKLCVDHDSLGSSYSLTCKEQIEREKAFGDSSVKKKAASLITKNMTNEYKSDGSTSQLSESTSLGRSAVGETGKKIDEQKSCNVENEEELEMDSATDNDDKSRHSAINCETIISNPTLAGPDKRRNIFFRYYAVRVGYAKASCFREGTDDLDMEREMRLLNEIGPMVKIRSAIFLYWDDACQFLEDIDKFDKCSSLDLRVEYEGFDSVAEAEAYLLEPETRSALKHVAIVERKFPKERPMSSDKAGNIDPTESNVSNLQLFNPSTLVPNPSYIIPINTAVCTVNKIETAVVETSDRKNLNTKSLRRRHVSKKNMIEKKPSAAPLKLVKQNKPQRPERMKITPKEKRERTKENKEKWWNFMFNELLKHKNDNDGSLDIPDEDEDDSNEAKSTNPDGLDKQELRRLRAWCDQQRRHHRHWVRCNTSVFFTQEKYDKLKDAGFQFSELSWDEQYKKLKAYKNTHTTLKVEKDHDEDLHKWVLKQRTALRRHFEGKPANLSEDRLNKLVDLGWQKSLDKKGCIRICDLAGETKTWNENYEKLIEYKEKNGNMVFPSGNSKLSKKDLHLRNWVIRVRKEYQRLQSGKEADLSAIQMKKLSDINFLFNPKKISHSKSNKEIWESRLQALKDYKARYGDFAMHKKEASTTKLIQKMRREYKMRQRGEHNGLTDKRIAQLEEIGFEFERGKTPKVRYERRSWEERFQHLLKYKEEHGHCIVPQIAGGMLGKWVGRQRKEYNNLMKGEPSSLTHEKALRLSSIGFCFDASSRFRGKIRGRQNGD